MHPDLARIEVAKTRQAARIAEASRLFTVPRVIDWDEDAGRIRFEFLPGLRAVKDIHNLGDVYGPLMRQIGQALAAVHSGLWLPDDMLNCLPSAYHLPRGEVFLHGDFCIGNVGLMEDGRLVIFDWQATPKIGGGVTWGTRYFDVMWFVYSLFYRPLGRQRYALDVAPTSLAREFMNGYFQMPGGAGHVRECAAYLDMFLRARHEEYRNGLHLKRRLLLLPGRMKYARFIRQYAAGC